MGGGQHDRESRGQQEDGPDGVLPEDILLQAEDADGEEQQAGNEEVLHLAGNAGEHEDAGDGRQQPLEEARFEAPVSR